MCVGFVLVCVFFVLAYADFVLAYADFVLVCASTKKTQNQHIFGDFCTYVTGGRYLDILVRTPTPSQILSPGSLNNTEWGGIHDVPKTQN